MNNKIKPYSTSTTLDTYSKLQTYDFHEFNGRKYQAVYNGSVVKTKI